MPDKLQRPTGIPDNFDTCPNEPEDMDGFHILSMLKLDDATRDIPVLTYTTEFDATEEDEQAIVEALDRVLTERFNQE